MNGDSCSSGKECQSNKCLNWKCEGNKEQVITMLIFIIVIMLCGMVLCWFTKDVGHKEINGPRRRNTMNEQIRE